MRIFGFDIRRKAAVGVTQVPQSAVGPSLLAVIGESFAGAWQRNITVESKERILAFSAVYACVALIASDISKLRIKLVEREDSGVWREVRSGSPFLPVLRKPNSYQTLIQFLMYWVTSLLLWGNTYVLKQRDARGIVTGLLVLDPARVMLLVTDDGGVYYQIKRDPLSRQFEEGRTIPASEIIHDRMLPLWHPLVGVSPIYAAGASATQGRRIQNNSAKFFENMSRPSGVLTAPGHIPDDTAKRLKEYWEQNFSGANMGRLAVLGDAMDYKPMTIPAADAQLIEQLKWTIEDVARAFRVPPHKLGVVQPTFNNVAALNQDYYSQTLQSLIESIELLLDEGLGLTEVPGKEYGTELDLDGLMRMDAPSRADRAQKLVGGGIMSPNEGRLVENLPPVAGGQTPYLQQQNWSLAALDKRPPPDSSPTQPTMPASPALPSPGDADMMDDADQADSQRNLEVFERELRALALEKAAA